MYTRNCPECGKELSYTNKYNRNKADKKQSLCNKCCISKQNRSGQNNAFYGKKHSDATKQKILSTKKQNGTLNSMTESKKENLRVKNSGSGNPMYGKRVYDIWIEKYGIEKANIKILEYKRKLSLASSGSNNPMYGKPTPKKAGNGWSGWYKDQYFRSLRELSFIVSYLEPNKLDWSSAENIRIPYTSYDGKNRTYSPDFLVMDTIYEIKPVKLIDTPLNILKRNAGEEYAKAHNLKYVVIDYDIIEFDKLKELIDNKLVKLTNRTEIKYNEWYKKCNNSNGSARVGKVNSN